ncbi:hypothetical protein KUH32_11505 [Thalassococcus sp. CAU 1522]|uniref:Uncharacterized protein n=1 Tax=Thalassococcus arenae TaxID=2851652 RepID=A0ABS6N8S4_9RHOB|nr:hypothetical protein [Thalassococcus arenae]MBV2360404.1 hypothetical protein [Thalassococcus arenae]
MPHGTKIATCTYCGTRAALVLTGTVRHELSCSACGAPLHDLKMLPLGQVDAAAHTPPAPGRKKRPEVHATPLPVWERAAQSGGLKRKKKKKRKSLAKRFFDEAFDALEDIFD